MSWTYRQFMGIFEVHNGSFGGCWKDLFLLKHSMYSLEKGPFFCHCSEHKRKFPGVSLNRPRSMKMLLQQRLDRDCLTFREATHFALRFSASDQHSRMPESLSCWFYQSYWTWGDLKRASEWMRLWWESHSLIIGPRDCKEIISDSYHSQLNLPIARRLFLNLLKTLNIPNRPINYIFVDIHDSSSHLG